MLQFGRHGNKYNRHKHDVRHLMAASPKMKEPPNEPKSLRGLTFKTLGVAFIPGHLKKVTVVLKVYRVTDLSGDGTKNRPI